MSKIPRRLNPVFVKEMQIGSRSVKIPIVIAIFNGLLSVIAVMAILITNGTSAFGQYDYTSLQAVFPFLSWVEFVLIGLFTAIITSSAIAGERERQTLEVMMTTPVKPMAIVAGKLGSVVAQMMIFVISSIPIMSIAFILGGLNWLVLPVFVLVMLFLCIYIGCIGVFCSSFIKKSVGAVVLTIVIWSGILFVTFLIVILIAVFSLIKTDSAVMTELEMGVVMLAGLFNPGALLVEFGTWAMNGSSIHDWFAEVLTQPSMVLFLSRFWLPIGMVLNLGIAWLFLKASSLVINPLRCGNSRK